MADLFTAIQNVLLSRRPENFANGGVQMDRSTAVAVLIYAILFKIVIIVIVMTLCKMIWNSVLIAMIPGLAPTTAFGIFALWFFISVMLS